MKVLLPKLAVLLAILISASCHASIFNGSWELVSGEYIDEKGVLVNYKDMDLHSLKTISDTHFSFISMQGDRFWSSGAGTYQVKDGSYIETTGYTSYGEKAGVAYEFKYKLEGDLWYSSRWKDGKKVEYEVWRKLH